VAVLLIFGTADPQNPESGGRVTGPNGNVLVKPAPMSSARRWSRYYRCTTTVGATVDIIRQTSFHSCQPDVPVIFLAVSGLGHQWPGGGPNLVDSHAGPQVANVRATDIIWDFFSRATAGARND
ncbi:MAG TPA: hypothetical protein VJ998_08070, partial [Pseudomonadales bacterium]|nr:hypothetical protein [Pseudomonadales bacterium]